MTSSLGVVLVSSKLSSRFVISFENKSNEQARICLKRKRMRKIIQRIQIFWISNSFCALKIIAIESQKYMFFLLSELNYFCKFYMRHPVFNIFWPQTFQPKNSNHWPLFILLIMKCSTVMIRYFH